MELCHSRFSDLFNIADLTPNNLAAELGTEQAARKAANMPTSQWSSVLRNALAHGGIAYLDETGQSSSTKPVKMYAFISGKYDERDKERLIGLNILRISEANYRVFLRKWVAWLRDAGLTVLPPAYLELEQEALLIALKLVPPHDRPGARK